MIIGDKKIFAIEYDILDKNDSMLPGYFSYWIGGKQIGDYFLVTYLSDVLLFMPWIIHDIGDRKYADRIDNENWDEIFEKIRVSIYESEVFDDNPARFDISIKVEPLLGTTILYIEDSKIGHIIYKDLLNDIHEFSVTKGYVDQVLLNTYKYLTSIFESLQ